jgi:hypothetical protein
MPEGTRVDNLFNKLKSRGYSVQSAAKIAQSATGLSLQTGKPPKEKSKSQQLGLSK